MKNLNHNLPTAEQRDRPAISGWDSFTLCLLALFFMFWQNRLASFDFIDRYGMEKLQSGLGYFLAWQRDFRHLTPSLTEYPPLPYWLTSGFFHLGGYSPASARLAMLSLTLILVFSLYRLGFILARRTGGWLLILLVLGNFWTILWSRSFEHNFAEMVMVSLAFAILLLSRGLNDKRFSLYLGLALGLCLLTRYAIIFLLPGLGWIILSRWWQGSKTDRLGILIFGGVLLAGWGLIPHLPVKSLITFNLHYPAWQLAGIIAALLVFVGAARRKNESSRLSNLLNAFLIAAFLALPWYLGTLNLQADKINHQWFMQQAPAYFLTSLRFFYHCYALIFPGFIVLLLIGLAFCLLNLQKLEYQLLLVSTLGGTLLICWLVPKEHSFRYILPMLPIVALTGICWLRNIPRWLKTLFLLAAGGFFLLNLSASNHLWSERSPVLRSWVAGQHRPLLLGGEQLNTPEKLEILKQLAKTIRSAYPEFPSQGFNLWYLNRIPGFHLNLDRLELILIEENYLPWGAFTLIKAIRPLGLKNQQQITGLLERYPNNLNLLLAGSPTKADLKSWEANARQSGLSLKKLGQGEASQTTWGLYRLLPVPETLSNSGALTGQLSRADLREGIRTLDFAVFRLASVNIPAKTRMQSPVKPWLPENLPAFYLTQVNYQKEFRIYLSRIPLRVLLDIAQTLQRRIPDKQRITLDFLNIIPSTPGKPSNPDGGKNRFASSEELKENASAPAGNLPFYWLVGAENPEDFKDLQRMLEKPGSNLRLVKEYQIAKIINAKTRNFRIRLYFQENRVDK